MAASRVFQVLTAGVAIATAAFQIQSQQRTKALESQRSKPTSHSESAPTHNNNNDNNSDMNKNDGHLPQSPEAPPLTSKARRELYKKLERGRFSMIHGYDHGIRETCEERCDELEAPCDIYEELQKLHERCKKGSGDA